jgi:hypothetical protein
METLYHGILCAQAVEHILIGIVLKRLDK